MLPYSLVSGLRIRRSGGRRPGTVSKLRCTDYTTVVDVSTRRVSMGRVHPAGVPAAAPPTRGSRHGAHPMVIAWSRPGARCRPPR